MQSYQIILGLDDPVQAAGAIVAAALDRPGGGHIARKGQTVGPAEIAALAVLATEAPGTPVSLIMPGADDIGEEAAAVLLGQAVAGPGVTVKEPGQGRVRLQAAHAGLFVVDRARLAAANAVPDINIYTIFDGTPVAAGTILAEAKITPLVAPRRHVTEAIARLQGPTATGSAVPVLEVHAFRPHRAALLVRERLAPAAAARMIGGLQRKLAWFGSALADADVRRTAGGPAEVAGLLQGLLDGGATLLLTAGGSTSDPADPILAALPAAGARLLRRGVPMHPGSLLWVAERDNALIVGVPSCGAFSEQTSLDLLLPRLLAHGAAGLDSLEALAEGGLLTRGMDHRFPPYGALE